MIVKTIALGNVKAADLQLVEAAGGILEVTLKGFSFYVVSAAPGTITYFTCQERNVKNYPDNQKYPFSAISDLKEFVRTCVGAYLEEQEKALDNTWNQYGETLKPKCPSVSDLAYQVTESGNLFFTKKTMKFFGDTLGNYGTRMVQQQDGSWIIELFRKRPVKHNTSSSAYFDAVTFKRLHSVTLKDGQ